MLPSSDQTSRPFASKLVKSSAVMDALGYTNRAAFWDFVKRSGVPHIRLNARRIMFDEHALSEWLTRRSSASR